MTKCTATGVRISAVDIITAEPHLTLLDRAGPAISKEAFQNWRLQSSGLCEQLSLWKGSSKTKIVRLITQKTAKEQ